MIISNEEMETLNRATEILSKYAAQGNLTKEDFDHFDRMIVAIIDGIDENDDLSETLSVQTEKDRKEKTYPDSKYRIKETYIKRDIKKEKTYGIDDVNIYAYYSDEESLCIVGEIFSKKPITEFCMICTIYDKEGDIIETEENESYGNGLVTSMIKPEIFFNGFPFKFNFWGLQHEKIKEIRIIPADCY